MTGDCCELHREARSRYADVLDREYRGTFVDALHSERRSVSTVIVHGHGVAATTDWPLSAAIAREVMARAIEDHQR